MKTLTKVKYNEKYWLVFVTGISHKLPDIQVILEDDKGKRLDDAIFHLGSYGFEEGRWEIMSQSLSTGTEVKGHLTWKQVEHYFDKTIRKLERT